jgi:hydroquinone glucosyltransferase
MIVSEIEATKPHVAVVSVPLMGHIIPLLEFSKRLVVEHDFHVSFLVITTTTEASAAQDQLLQSPTFPPGLDVVYLPPIDVFSVTTDDMLVLTRLCVMVEESLKSLKSVLKELGELRAVVIDKFFTQAFDVCCELSIPAYLFYTSAIVMLTFSLSLPTLDCEVEGEFVDLAEPLKVPGCPPFPIEDLFDPLKNRKIDEYKWLLFHSSRFHLAAGIFVNSWKELEPVTYKAITEDPFFKQIPTPPVLPVGPLIKVEEPLTARDIEYLAWLDKQPSDSVLFVALGSGGTLTADQLTELAWGIELSHQRFIFVVRKPTNSSASAAVFTAGSDIGNPMTYLPEGFLERTQGRGLVVPSWAPQVAVLKHPSTGGFLSHCGWNSTLEILLMECL